MEKFLYYKGVKFTRDDKTGYYLNSTIRERMHRFVWRDHFGDIPDGCDIHHIDGDKSNNDISNLAMLPSEEHHKMHSAQLTEEQRERLRRNMNENARPAACKWHKSDVGREWHKKHYLQMSDNLHRTEDKTCENCGKTYTGAPHSHYCCNACKSAYRRKIKADYIQLICPICGNEYSTNKFAPAMTCGRSCAGELRWRQRRESSKSDTA